MKTTIIGAGVYGTALGGVLAGNGHDIEYYDTFIKDKTLSGTITDADLIIECVPSNVVQAVLSELPHEKPLIIATKGILSDEIFQDFTDWMVLSGPGYAEDIKHAKPTHLTATDPRIIKLFTTDYLDFDQTNDKKGVLMCGALKNAYAIGAGLRNLKPDTAEHRQYLQDTSNEMKLILEANGANPSTVDLNCGIGDLIITCYYPSRNYEFGQILRKDSSAQPTKTVEGLTTLDLIKRGDIKLPDGLLIMKELINAIK